MGINSNTNRVDKKYMLITAIAVILSWIFHEFAHWVAGRSIGYEMIMTLNNTYPANKKYLSDTDFQIISAAGPLFTLAEAIVIFVIMQLKKNKLLYPFLFTCFYMRLLAMIISFLNPNDEARISSSLGIGKFTLPLIMSAILFLLIYKTSQRYRFSIRFNLINLALIIFYSSIIILSDQFYCIRLI